MRLILLLLLLAIGWWLLHRPAPAPKPPPTAQTNPSHPVFSLPQRRHGANPPAAPPASIPSCEQRLLQQASVAGQLQQQLAQLASELQRSGQRLDGQLLALLHPQLLSPALRTLLPSLLARLQPAPAPPSLDALQAELTLLHWLPRLRQQSSALPPGHSSVSAFLQQPLSDGRQIKHLLLSYGDALPSPLLQQLLQHSSWNAEDLPLLPLTTMASWPASHWPPFFALFDGEPQLLLEQLLGSEPYLRVMLDAQGISHWQPLLAAVAELPQPALRWPLPGQDDLLWLDRGVAASPTASPPQLSLNPAGQLQLPLWPQAVALATALPPPQPRSLLAGYTPAELQQLATLRQQLQPTVARLEQLLLQQQAGDDCQQQQAVLAAAWQWSLAEQGVAPLAALGLDCLDPQQLPALAELDPAVADHCRQHQQGERSLIQGQPLEHWLTQLANARRGGSLQGLRQGLANPSDGRLLSRLISQLTPELWPPLLASGLVLDSQQLDWLDSRGLAVLLESGLTPQQLQGERSLFNLLAANAALNEQSLQLLLDAGFSDSSPALAPDSLDLLLQQLINQPRQPPFVVIDGLLAQLPLRPSHWRRMAVLQQVNPLLFGQLVSHQPALQPAAGQEARLYY